MLSGNEPKRDAYSSMASGQGVRRLGKLSATSALRQQQQRNSYAEGGERVKFFRTLCTTTKNGRCSLFSQNDLNDERSCVAVVNFRTTIKLVQIRPVKEGKKSEQFLQLTR